MDEGELRDRFNSAAFVSPTGGEEVRSCWCAHVESRYISPGTCLLLLSYVDSKIYDGTIHLYVNVGIAGYTVGSMAAFCLLLVEPA